MIERVIPFKERMVRKFGRTFVYDPQRRVFLLGNGDSNNQRAYSVAEAHDAFDFHRLSDRDLTAGLGEREQPYFLIVSGFDLVVMPEMKKFVESMNDAQWREMRQLVEPAIATIVELSGLKARREEGFRSISARQMDKGNFILTTIGDCACLGPEMYKTSSDENTSNFPQEYGLHNGDMPWQRLSLYAGIGALAWYAEIETAKD